MEEQEQVFVVPKKRMKVTIPIMLCGIAATFFVGSYFDLFGSKIDFINKPSTFLFLLCILFGGFGAIHTFVPFRVAIKGTIYIGLIFLALYFVGKLSRGEL